MSRAGKWKKIFGHSEKPKVQVHVGEKLEELTDTQAYRFKELARRNAQRLQATNDNPFEQSSYSLEEAAFRLMIGEGDLLQRAASGSIDLFVDAAGLAGRWRRLDAGSSVSDSSSVRTLRSGYLALTAHSRKELAKQGSTSVSILKLPSPSNSSAAGLDAETLQELSAWGNGEKRFCLCEPLLVDRNRIVLLAPLR